jgi:hypothetical protein
MAVLLVLGVVSAVIVLYVGERLLKARARIRRRQMMSERLDAAARRAERHQQKKQAVTKASEALTSYLPAINQPPLSVPGTDRESSAEQSDTGQSGTPQPAREHTGPQRRLHLGRRGPRSGEHPVRSRTGPHAAVPTRRHRPDAAEASAGAKAAETRAAETRAAEAPAAETRADAAADGQ